jgi:serine/threonine protein kinase
MDHTSTFAPVLEEVVDMDIVNSIEEEEVELFPRWFKETESCAEGCQVCITVNESKAEDQGTFGVVRLRDNNAQKIIQHDNGRICYTALREMVTFNQIGSGCPHLMCLSLPIIFDTHSNSYITMPRASCSLLNFARCAKLRQSVPGYERLSVHYLLWCLLRAVTYLNNCNLMHRDIKPGNVLVFPGPRVVLSDYGGCRFTNAYLEKSDVVMSDLVCTKLYSPPEEASGKHNSVFDTYSIAATVIHYTMSKAPNFQTKHKVNRRIFQKLCKPHHQLLVLLRLMCIKNPDQRVCASVALRLFEESFPGLCKKFSTYFDYSSPVLTVPLFKPCTWTGYHHLSRDIWPCILEAIQKTESCKNNVVVAFYTLNLLHRLHDNGKGCTDTHCYVMFLPSLIRLSILMTGSADLDENTPTFYYLFRRHFCVNVGSTWRDDSLYTYILLSEIQAPFNWEFPADANTIMDLQNKLNV